MSNDGVGGTGSASTKQKIDAGRVTVPARIRKVLIMIPESNEYLNRNNSSNRISALKTPNINTIRIHWGSYLKIVDAIENEGGYDLLSELPNQVQLMLDSKVNNRLTQ